MKGACACVLVAVGLTGCAFGPVAPATSTSSSAERQVSGGESARLPDRNAPGAGATTALLAQSRAERRAGNLGDAVATIERALAIAPEEGLLWVELAEIHSDQGERALAREMARKALTLTAADSEVADRARRLIAQ